MNGKRLHRGLAKGVRFSDFHTAPNREASCAMLQSGVAPQASARIGSRGISTIHR